jgi:hypothetical protein
MSPILSSASGISARSYGFTNGFEAPNSYFSIESVLVGSGGVSTVSFSSIPQTYKHLQLRYMARTTDTSQNTVYAVFNSDTTANYSHHLLYGGGVEGVGAEYGNSESKAFVGSISNNNRAANCFSIGVVDFFDYASTSKTKTFRSLTGREDGSAGISILNSSTLFNGTAALTSLVLSSTGNLAEFSQFSLYGIKG